MLEKFNAGAASLTTFRERANFFRLLSTEADCTVYFYRQGREVARAEAVSGGYAEKFDEEFDEIAIESDAAQIIQFVLRLGNVVTYDAPPMGLVTVANTGGAFVNAAKEVTNASAQLLAAKVGRRYLLIQNNDAAGILYVTLDGTAATEANGVKILPGGSIELTAYCPTGEIRALGSIASNPNVVVVEG